MVETSDSIVALLMPRVAHLLGIGEVLSERRQAVERGIRDVYAFHRRETLESHYWSFAESLAILRHAGDKPAFGYSYYSRLPNDFIGLTYMNFSGELNTGLVGAYQIFGGKIATNSTPVYISYTRNELNLDLYSPLFIKTLAYSIAMELSLSLAGDKDLGDRLERMRAAFKYESIEVDYRNQGDRETVQGRDVLNSHISPGSGLSDNTADGVVRAEVEVTPLPGLFPPPEDDNMQP